MQHKPLFSEAFFVQPSLLRRLIDAVFEGIDEFRKNPRLYLEVALKGDGLGGRRRQTLLRFGMALAVVLYAIGFTAVLVFWWLQHRPKPEGDPESVTMLVNPADFQMQQIDMPKAKEKAGGGGGGGRKTPTPPSKGQLPVFSLKPPIIAPRPEPQLRTPALPVPETVQVDPRLQPKRDDLAPTGLPTGVPGPPSAGPGEGGGMGSGRGGGMGPGNGTGVGPGEGFNMGGGSPRLGGGDGVATNVDVRPVALNAPRPNYTEEARKNKISGVVHTRILIASDGSVKQVRIVGSGLPDGLNEEAIRAAYLMRFRPAMKSGQPVSVWQLLDITFTLR
ncbi:MAG TPA: TonB family protein [Blastocatellia bacterium]|nr:TonB family protein [Blastocatellia bacterium]